MKYITSCTDIALVFLLLVMYARIEIPSVALKNYVFLVVFPLIALTAFRFDSRLTWTAGGASIGLYLTLLLYLVMTDAVTLTNGGYDDELFTPEVTIIGQATKVLMLTLFVALVAYLARYSRSLITTLVHNEVSLRGEKELMDWEMRIASQVQQQFLPHSLPQVDGLEFWGAVRQGRSIGGDYYDLIRLAPDRLLLVVADVSGKGVPAALIMAEVRASVQLLASMQTNLEDLTRRLNTLIHQSTDKKHFVTFVAAEFNTTRNDITYVCAGHPPPLMWSQHQVRQLTRGTLPLGVQESLPGLVVRSEPLQPRSVIVAFTDGILERSNADGEQYGDSRLSEFLRTHAPTDVETFAKQLFENVDSFGGGRDPDDDATLAVVRRLE